MKLTSTKRLMRFAAAPLLLAGLSACATGFNADVSRFATQLPAPQGQTFAVVADDPALAGGPRILAICVLRRARKWPNWAMRPRHRPRRRPCSSVSITASTTAASACARPVSLAIRSIDPWYGYSPYYRTRFYRHRGFYSPRSAWGYGFYDPWLGGNEVTSYTVYTSGIDMKIDDTATGERLFEGKAQALSTSNRLQYLVPNLVEAMFTDFPGKSGETLRISIKPEETKVRRVD